MKIYPQTFEKVFSEDSIKKYDFSEILTEGMNIDEYSRTLKELMGFFSYNLFDFYVKIAWLKRKFSYKGTKAEIRRPVGAGTDYVFSRFVRRIIGNDTQFFTRDFLYPKINSYFKDFFPFFDDGNPFKDKDYKFPFKNITIEFLPVVYQLDDRIEMLKYADNKKMTYASFLDFVINQIYSINEEIGRDRYIFMRTKNCQNYVKDTDKKLISTKKKKNV